MNASGIIKIEEEEEKTEDSNGLDLDSETKESPFPDNDWGGLPRNDNQWNHHLESKCNDLNTYFFNLVDNFRPTKEQLTMAPFLPASPLQETKLVLVYTKSDLLQMLAVLRNCKEISVNVHYDDHAYPEDVTILAISTQTADYLIDAVPLRIDMYILSEIFLNPNIVKIMYLNRPVHSALKHAFNISCVNIFDVNTAFEKLQEKPENSFITRLRKEYPGIRKDITNLKHSGIIRLTSMNPSQMDQLRCIPHYLIYFYYECKNKLIQKGPNLLEEVFMKCNKASKCVLPNRHTSLSKSIKARQEYELYIFEKGMKWRTKAAKTSNVLPSEVLKLNELDNIITNAPMSVDDMKIVAPSFATSPRLGDFMKLLLAGRKTIGAKYSIKMKRNPLLLERDQEYQKMKELEKRHSIEQQSNEIGDPSDPNLTYYVQTNAPREKRGRKSQKSRMRFRNRQLIRNNSQVKMTENISQLQQLAAEWKNHNPFNFPQQENVATPLENSEKHDFIKQESVLEVQMPNQTQENIDTNRKSFEPRMKRRRLQYKTIALDEESDCGTKVSDETM